MLAARTRAAVCAGWSSTVFRTRAGSARIRGAKSSNSGEIRTVCRSAVNRGADFQPWLFMTVDAAGYYIPVKAGDWPSRALEGNHQSFYDAAFWCVAFTKEEPMDLFKRFSVVMNRSWMRCWSVRQGGRR